jgi:hypothetical protein
MPGAANRDCIGSLYTQQLDCEAHLVSNVRFLSHSEFGRCSGRYCYV